MFWNITLFNFFLYNANNICIVFIFEYKMKNFWKTTKINLFCSFVKTFSNFREYFSFLHFMLLYFYCKLESSTYITCISYKTYTQSFSNPSGALILYCLRMLNKQNGKCFWCSRAFDDNISLCSAILY